ncbi:murein biosynthesis integral membrane protein MurJ [Rhodovibrionaceae bacterium A322]
MGLFKSFLTVGGFTAASRVLGFVRDILIAGALGSGPVADAFFVAFRFPNLFRRLFAEGAFNAAFVPLFASALEGEGRIAARQLAEESLSVLLTALLLLTAAAMATMPWLMPVIAPGFVGQAEQFDLAVQLTRIAFPYLLFMALTALLSGVLNSLYKFAAAAAAPIVLNLCFIVSLALVLPWFPAAQGQVLAWTVAFAGLLQFLLLFVAAARQGMALRLPRPRLTPRVRRLLKLMLPGVLSAGALQINILIGTMIATLQAGAVSYLYYADRVYQLPLGLIGIGLGIVLLPDLTRRLKAKDESGALNSQNRAVELSLFLTLPATVALLVIPQSIVTVLFERGAFTPDDARDTAFALLAFATGLPAYVLTKILQPGFYARQDTTTPFHFALIGVAANVVLSLVLFFQIGFVGIALATALSAWLQVVLLAGRLWRLGHFVADSRLLGRLPRILLASVVMGGGLWVLEGELAGALAGAELVRAPALALLVAVGLLAYLALAFATRAVTLSDLKGLVRRRAG